MNTVGGVFQKIVTDKVMYKFPDYWKDNFLPLHITEYIACKLIEYWGIPVQHVKLTYVRNEEAIEIKLFDNQLVPFYNMREITLNTENIPERNLNNHKLETYEKIINKRNAYKFKFSQEELNNYLYKILAIDILIANIDRHPGNIGLIKENMVYDLAPIYDSSLSLWIEDFINKKESSNRLSFRKKRDRIKPKEAIRLYGDRINNILTTLINKGNNLKDSFQDIQSIYGNRYNNYLEFLSKRYKRNIEEVEEWISNQKKVSDISIGHTGKTIKSQWIS